MSHELITRDFISRLRAFIRRRVRSGEDADDILQNTLLKFVQHEDEIGKDSGPAWVFQVARRELVDHFRRRMDHGAVGTLPEVETADNIQSSALHELSHCVEPLLDALAASDQAILRRVDLLGESQSAIADACGIPRSTVKARLQRARKRFLRTLQRCCSLNLDARGTPISYASTNKSACDCSTRETSERRSGPEC